LFSVLLEAAPSTAAPERQPLPGGSGDVLSGADGTLAWLVANAPLTLQQADGITHALDEVVCTQRAWRRRVPAACWQRADLDSFG
jgi:hypothetical protein